MENSKNFKSLVFGGFLVGLLKALVVICLVSFVVGLALIGNILMGGDLGIVGAYALGFGFFGYIHFTALYLFVKAVFIYIRKKEA